MTEREAMIDARETAHDENGHMDGYSGDINSSCSEIKSKCLVKPVPAKRCSVVKNKQEGARKWVTKYVVMGGYRGDDEITSRDTQADALKFAKEYSLQKNETVRIEIKKFLVGSSSHVATITPNKAVMGKWEFTGMARC
jgi:hypothetical protein